MRIERVSLDSIGSYSGEYHFELAPTQFSTGGVTVFVGHNGSGKTTLFQAIGIGLYGRRFFGRRTSRSEYLSRVASMVSRVSGTSTDKASVAVTALMHLVGRPVRVSITRTWSRTKRGLSEQLEVLHEDGERLRGADAEVWISAQLRSSLASLSFFDAEDVASLSSSDLSAAVEQMIEHVVGLDIVNDLVADLEHYLASCPSSARDKSSLQLQRTSDVIRELRGELDESVIDEQQLGRERRALEASIEELSLELALRGASGSQGASAVRNASGRALASLKAAEEEAQRLLSGLAPFLLCPGLSERFRQRLSRDEETSQARIVRDFLDAASPIAVQRMSEDPPLVEAVPDAATRESIADAAVRLVADLAPEPNTNRLLHDLGWSERERLRTWLARSRETGLTLSLLRARLLELSGALAAAQNSDVPDDEQIRDLQRRLSLRSGELEKNHLAFAAIKERQGAIRGQLSQSELEHDRLLRVVAASVGHDQTRDTAIRAINALVGFREHQKEDGLRRIERLVQAEFGNLCRKRLLVSELSISRLDYSVTIQDEGDQEMDLSTLAASERQLFMLALVTSMREVAQLHGPLLIDAPLGRLDQLHTETLHDRISCSPHQTLLFLTDTEFTSYCDVGTDGLFGYTLASDGPGRPTRVLPLHLETVDEARS